MRRSITDLLAGRRRALENLARSLIRIPTVNPPGERYADMAALLTARLDAMGLKAKAHRVADADAAAALPHGAGYPRYNVIARLDVGAPRTVHFNAHYDVVPVSGDWSGDPFGAKIDGDWLYGRGAADMKGMIAACIIAVETLIRAGVEPRVNVELSFTADEETGGVCGAGHIVRRGLVNADYAVVCEGGYAGKVGVGHKGVLWLDVGVQGKAAHAAYPKRGVNAFEHAAALAVRLAAVKTTLARRRYTGPGGTVYRPAINIGGVFGPGDGAKINTIPGYAHFTIDRRVLPNETVREAEAQLRRTVRAARGDNPRLRAQVARLLAMDPCVVDHRRAMPRAFARSVRAVAAAGQRFTCPRASPTCTTSPMKAASTASGTARSARITMASTSASASATCCASHAPTLIS